MKRKSTNKMGIKAKKPSGVLSDEFKRLPEKPSETEKLCISLASTPQKDWAGCFASEKLGTTKGVASVASALFGMEPSQKVLTVYYATLCSLFLNSPNLEDDDPEEAEDAVFDVLKTREPTNELDPAHLMSLVYASRHIARLILRDKGSSVKEDGTFARSKETFPKWMHPSLDSYALFGRRCDALNWAENAETVYHAGIFLQNRKKLTVSTLLHMPPDMTENMRRMAAAITPEVRDLMVSFRKSLDTEDEGSKDISTPEEFFDFFVSPFGPETPGFKTETVEYEPTTVDTPPSWSEINRHRVLSHIGASGNCCVQ
jgi:hypothetical protein